MRITQKLGRAVLVAAVGSVFALTAGTSAAQMKHDQVQFISGSPTGSWFPVASMAAELTNKAYEGQPVSVIPGAGGVGNPLRVGTGQSDIGTSYGPFLKLAQEGNNDLYKEAFPKLRAICGMTSNKLHIVADEGSASDNLAELAKTKPAIRVGTGPTGSTELFSLTEVLKLYGVTLDDIKGWGGRVDLLNTAGRTDGWSNRQLDLVNFFINNPDSSVIQLMAAKDDSKLLSIDDRVRDALVEKWGMIKFDIPAGEYPQQDDTVQTVGMPYVYFTTTDLDADFVYNMTKAIAENQPQLAKSHAAFESWKPEDMYKGLGIELHEGAKRYYRERGWIE